MQRDKLVSMGLSRDAIQRAARQGGYINRAQLLRAGGLSVATIDRMVSSGELVSVVPGVYRVFPSNDPADLIRGAVLALPGAVASHESAAHLLDFPRLPTLRPTVTVASHTTHRFPGVTVRRADDLVRAHLTTVDEIRVTNIPRTAFDLAGILVFREFDAIAQALILDGRLKLRHFELITDQLARRGKPGSRSARDFLEIRWRTGPKATVLERKGRAILASAGLPTPIPEYPIPWSPDRRFDDAYPEAQLAVEWDSRAWHGQLEAMTSDRRRDREAAAHGWVIERFTWEDVTEHANEVARSVAGVLRERTAAS